MSELWGASRTAGPLGEGGPGGLSKLWWRYAGEALLRALRNEGREASSRADLLWARGAVRSAALLRGEHLLALIATLTQRSMRRREPIELGYGPDVLYTETTVGVSTSLEHRRRSGRESVAAQIPYEPSRVRAG
jgi:hypothetical protein